MGVALASLTLLLPFALLSLAQQLYLMAAGSGLIVLMLSLSTLLAFRGLDHERLTLFALVPGGMLFLTQVFREEALVAAFWCYPAVLGVYCMLGWRRAIAANAIILAVALPMSWQTLDPALAARIAATLIAVSLFAGILVHEIDAMRRRLRYQIERDPLTGLLNRNSLARRLERSITSRRSHPDAALLAIDLDHFKVINDRFGHDTGDLVLCEVSRLLRSLVRPRDAVFRLGGEEFLVTLERTGEREALACAERLRAGIARARILQHHPVTASIGMASLRGDDDHSSWIRRADERLYAAKRAGRDRVVSDAEPLEDGTTSSLVEPSAPRRRAPGIETSPERMDF